MSLINRMLRDLSARQPAAGNVMSGIQLPSAPAQPRGGAPARLGMLAVLIAVFTGGLWWMFGPRPIAIPQPRGMAAGQGAAPAVARSDPATSAVAPSAEPARLQMDTRLSVPAQVPAEEPAPAPAPAPAIAPAPAATPVPAASVEPAAPAPRPKPRPAPPKAEPELAAAPETAPATPASTITPSSSGPNGAALYAEARRALESGDEVSAEGLLVQALVADPELHAAREDLGTLHVRKGALDQAEQVARAGLDLAPGWVGYRRLAGRIELARRRPAAALEILQQGVPAVEADTEYHALLASAYQRLNRHEDASRVYQNLARVQPELPSWWAGYGMSRDALNDVPGALAGYARARQLGGLDPRVLEHINRRTAVLQGG